MRTLYFLLFVGVTLFTTSCNQSGQKKAITATDANEVTQDQNAGLTACQHASKIYWKGAKPTGEHNGIIKLSKGGDFIVEDGKLVGGTFIIDMKSIICLDIDNADMNQKLVGHLESEDFFYIDSFPTAKFEITTVEKISSGEYNTLLEGNLTLRGVTKGIAFKAKVNVREGAVSAKSEEFLLDRTQWNIKYKSKTVFNDLKDKFINDEFSLMIDAHSM